MRNDTFNALRDVYRRRGYSLRRATALADKAMREAPIGGIGPAGKSPRDYLSERSAR